MVPDATAYLEKAEQAAHSLDNGGSGEDGASARDCAYADIAAAYVEAGALDRGRDLAMSLPPSLREAVLYLIPVILAEQGDRVAVTEAMVVIDPMDVGRVARALATRMPDIALSLMDRVAEGDRSQIYRMIVETAAQRGDWDLARGTVGKITDCDEKAAAETMIAVGQMVDCGGDVRSLFRASGVAISVIEHELTAVLIARAKSGDPAKVVEVTQVLQSPKAKSEIYIALARRYQEMGRSDAFAGAIEAALCSASEIRGGELVCYSRIAAYVQIADLQLTVDDRAAAVETLHLAQEQYAGAKKEFVGFPPPLVKPLLLELMMRAGLEEEARTWGELDKESADNLKLLVCVRAHADKPAKVDQLLRSAGPELRYSAYLAAAKQVLRRPGHCGTRD